MAVGGSVVSARRPWDRLVQNSRVPARDHIPAQLSAQANSGQSRDAARRPCAGELGVTHGTGAGRAILDRERCTAVLPGGGGFQGARPAPRHQCPLH
jgi:hypothetical protein